MSQKSDGWVHTQKEVATSTAQVVGYAADTNRDDDDNSGDADDQDDDGAAEIDGDDEGCCYLFGHNDT